MHLPRPVNPGVELGSLPFSQESFWGYKMTVTPEISDEGINVVLANHKSEMDACIQDMKRIWTPKHDEQLIQYANSVYIKSGEACSSLPIKLFPVPQDSQVYIVCIFLTIGSCKRIPSFN
jgi:hypothetical protein